MSADITDILREWEFDSDNQIRIIQADDGRQVLQVRQPMGVEQYELDGRPDGKKPFGRESMVEEYRTRLDNYASAHGSDEGFTITHDDFSNLQGEGVLYYFRYLVLFQIGDFVRTARDTEHNLSLFTLVEKYGENDEDRKELLQYKPYVVRMNAIARAMISLHKEMKDAAEDILTSAINAIEGMNEIDTPAFQFERVRSLNYLKATLKQIHEKKDNPLDTLKSELKEAVDEEDYEKAASIRDRIREAENAEGGSDSPEPEGDSAE
ncbi:MAG: UvrB/UvrC motif-containing protein [Spirochaetia bacterium]|jgi:hypothetical protein